MTFGTLIALNINSRKPSLRIFLYRLLKKTQNPENVILSPSSVILSVSEESIFSDSG